MRRVSGIFLVCVLLIATGLATCSAALPLRVAILPVIAQPFQVDEATGKVIEKALANKFRTPLTGSVPVYDVIAQPEIAPALSVGQPGGKQRVTLDKSTLANIAEKINADIVIAAEVRYFDTQTYVSHDGDVFRRTSMEIRLLSYHRASGEFIDRKDHENYNGDERLWGQPDYIAEQLMAALLDKVPNYR